MRPTVATLVLVAAGTTVPAQLLEPVPVWMEPEILGFGSSVATCGDMNGDGYDDVIIGGPFWNAGASQQPGAVQIFFGSGSGLSEEYQWFWTGPDTLSTLGEGVAFAGDVNGDGYDDVAIGRTEGRVFLFLGSEIGVQPVPAWANDVVPDGSVNLGGSVDRAGDVNGDGLIDLLVGDPPWRALAFLGAQSLTVGPAGSMDDASLLVGRDAEGRIVLGRGASCAGGDEDYALYRGALEDFESHTPVTCSTGGLTTWTVSGIGGDQYFLVVARTLDSEGSYGQESLTGERLPSWLACYPQAIAGCE